MPQFTLMIYGNFKPGLKSVDEAIRRRMKLIPFTVTIPKDKRDKKLIDEAQGGVGRHSAVDDRGLPDLAARGTGHTAVRGGRHGRISPARRT